jgi:hypothetical protein
VRESQKLLEISKYLGRFREIFAQGKKNAYSYGRGETYSVELGNNLSRTLTSELAMLSAPETLPLFLRKYQNKQLKQYRRREAIVKGMDKGTDCMEFSLESFCQKIYRTSELTGDDIVRNIIMERI